jgi:hypothetical protein
MPQEQEQGQPPMGQESSSLDAVEMFFAQPEQASPASITAADQVTDWFDSGIPHALTQDLAITPALFAEGATVPADEHALADPRWALAAALVGLARATRVSEEEHKRIKNGRAKR